MADAALSPGVVAGRDRELTALREWRAEALAGRGRLVVLTGPPGIGKTRLAEELADEAVRGDDTHDRYEQIKQGDIHIAELQRMTMPQLIEQAPPSTSRNTIESYVRRELVAGRVERVAPGTYQLAPYKAAPPPGPADLAAIARAEAVIKAIASFRYRDPRGRDVLSDDEWGEVLESVTGDLGASQGECGEFGECGQLLESRVGNACVREV